MCNKHVRLEKFRSQQLKFECTVFVLERKIYVTSRNCNGRHQCSMSSQLMYIVESADALQIVRRKFEVHQLLAALLCRRSSALAPLNYSFLFKLLFEIDLMTAGVLSARPVVIYQIL